MVYTPKEFALTQVTGLSPESVTAHVGLYQGYVKNFNAIIAEREALVAAGATTPHAIAELTRRLGFEFNGIRLHELYFTQWEGTLRAIDEVSPLGAALTAQYGSVAAWEKEFRMVGAMRGPGWAILYFDPEAKMFHNVWVEEHMQGHFATLPIILALDVWEHAFIAQYGATGRGAYIDATFTNYNWAVMEERFTKVQ